MANLGHGGNVKEISRNRGLDFKEIIDFSANINPIGMPESAREAIVEGIYEVEKYPDITYFELRENIKKFENRESENITIDDIILGNGAAEVLFNVVRGIKPKNALILAPTFSEYEEAVNSVNGNKIFYKLKEENDFQIKSDILNLIDENLDLIFICNPNNPTGVITEKHLLEKILKKAKDNNVILIIDESFLDFLEDNLSMISYINQYDNLIIIKSLTKFFAIPGLRIGYGISRNYKIKSQVNEISPAWNINILAEMATKAALNDNIYISQTLKYINDERNFLYNELTQLDNIKIFKPSVNFILLKTVYNMDLKNIMLKENILIRSCDNYKGLNNMYYRIAVKNHEDNKKLIVALKKYL